MNRTNKLGNVIRGLIYGGDGSINNIPHIDLNNFWGDGVSGKLNDYRTKQAQLKANIGWVYSANSAKLISYRDGRSSYRRQAFR